MVLGNAAAALLLLLCFVDEASVMQTPWYSEASSPSHSQRGKSVFLLRQYWTRFSKD